MPTNAYERSRFTKSYIVLSDRRASKINLFKALPFVTPAQQIRILELGFPGRE